MHSSIIPDFSKDGKISIIVDGQFGSTGKGLIASRIALDNDYEIAIGSLSPNAGHTFYKDTVKCVSKCLPVCGIMKSKGDIFLSADSVIDPNILFHEIETFNINEDRIFIHPRAAILTEEIKQKEKQNEDIKKISSTQSGTGEARSLKIMRIATLAEDYKPMQRFIRPYNLKYYLQQGCSAIVETGQGLGLGLNHGLSYPYCTSRDVLPATILGELGLHPKYLGNVMLTFRTYPIRVGNIIENNKEVSYSGPFYDDSKEVDFSYIGVPAEKTTVTQRIRRIATFSMKQYIHAIDVIEPNFIFLNFIQYFYRHEEDLIVFPKNKTPTHVGYGPYSDHVCKWEPNILQHIFK